MKTTEAHPQSHLLARYKRHSPNFITAGNDTGTNSSLTDIKLFVSFIGVENMVNVNHDSPRAITVLLSCHA